MRSLHILTRPTVRLHYLFTRLRHDREAASSRQGSGMSRQNAPLIVSLSAIAVFTTISAIGSAGQHPAAPDPVTTSAFEQLARRAGDGTGPAAVVAPASPGSARRTVAVRSD